MRLRYDIKGMSCAACVSHVERAVRRVIGDEDSFTVSLLTNSLTIITRDDRDEALLREELRRAIRQAGYELVTETEPPKKRVATDRRVVVLSVSAALTLCVMYFSMGSMMGLWVPPFLEGIWMALVQLAFTIPVIVLNFKFFSSGTRALLHLAPNMDSLIAVGAGASVLYGLINLLLMLIYPENAHTYAHDLYFESAAMILTLVSFGKLLEARAKDRASDAVGALSSLSPALATVLRDGKETVVTAEELVVGDLVLLRAGDRIPVDGVVVNGRGSADESALTGESMPVEKDAGDAVRAACVLTDGALTVRAERVGEETSLSRIIRLLEDVAASKAPIARIADKVSAVFVPVVMGISLVTLVVWLLATRDAELALRSAIAVLVISCPCALGLATPTAITVGVGRGARLGILFRNAEALEGLCGVRTMMMDKTGTLTEGRPTLTDVILPAGEDPAKILGYAAAVEHLSSHPLASAICRGAGSLGVCSIADVTDFKVQTGVGAEGRIGDLLCRIGKPNDALREEKSIENAIRVEKNAPFDKKDPLAPTLGYVSDATCLGAALTALEDAGKTAVVVFFNDSPVAVLGIADRVRTDAKNAVEALEGAGVHCIMLTGDNVRTAASVASQTGIGEYHASLLPEDKESFLAAKREAGTCAMVGDGINDAPALMRADVGIAVGAGTEIAIDSADVVLSNNSIAGVADAYFLSRATIRIIKENLFWALFYNAVCIPIAAGVLYPTLGVSLSPMLASAAMSLSSVFVVTNALRLRTVKLRKKGEQDMLFKKELTTHTITVEGMMCPRCVAHVKEALEGVKGVKNATVDLESKTATVTVPASVSLASLTDAIKKAGYEVV